MSTRYETVMILTPVLSKDQAKEAVQKFRKVLTDAGAKIQHEESWGPRLQNHPIAENKSTGYYHLFEFEGTGNAVTEVELAYKRDERVLRFMTIRLSD
jgi:small subunit ribosomal protein S6